MPAADHRGPHISSGPKPACPRCPLVTCNALHASMFSGMLCTQSLQDVSQPSPHLFVLPARAMGLLTPQIEHGRSPLQCRPSPWPAERGSRRSVHLSCRESSPAQRWSVLSHGGSTDSRELSQTTRRETGHAGAAAPHSAFVSQVSLLSRALRWATGNRKLHKIRQHLSFQRIKDRTNYKDVHHN